MQINRGLQRPRCNTRIVDLNPRFGQEMRMNLRALLVAAALAFSPNAAHATENVTVYKDAT